MAPPTAFNVFLWNWLNQTYYASLNYGNRNATNVQSTVAIMLSYTAAAVSSVAIAVLLRRFLIGNIAMKAGNQILLSSTINFAALAGAGVVNAATMRAEELKNGIQLYDELEEPTVGLSKKAAR